ncbi:MAG: nucleotidyltransferase domain-containing protein [Bryobacteraceae bacterium]|jgi:predicted nucleotidyltransferase
MQALSLPSEKALVLEQVADHLGAIPNVAAVVLGGSYAREFARPDSDLDIGIYYRQAAPFPVERIRDLARQFSRAGAEPSVTELYEWGPWVNTAPGFGRAKERPICCAETSIKWSW